MFQQMKRKKYNKIAVITLSIMTYISYIGHGIQTLESYYFDTKVGDIKLHTQLFDILLMIIFGIAFSLTAIDKLKVKKIFLAILMMIGIRLSIQLSILGKGGLKEALVSIGIGSILWRLVLVLLVYLLMHFVFKHRVVVKLALSPALLMPFLVGINVFDPNLLYAMLLRFNGILDGKNITNYQAFRAMLPNAFFILLVFFIYLIMALIIGHYLIGKDKVSVSGIFSIINIFMSYTLISYMMSSDDIYANVLMYWVNIILMFLIFLALHQIIGKIILTNLLFFITSFVFAIANFLKIKYRQEPIIPSDLNEIKNFSELIKMVPFQVILLGAIAIISFVILYLMAFRKRDSRTALKIYKRLLILIIALGSFTLITFSFADSKSVDEKNIGKLIIKFFSYENIDYMGVLPSSRINGPILSFSQLVVQKQMDKPEEYSKSKMLSIYKKYQNEANTINATRKNKLSDGSVVFILSESFADPTRIPGLKLSEDPIPFIRSLKQQTTSGLMLSLGYGGGTANIEYEALSSLPMTNYNGSLTTPYSQLVPRLKYFPNLADSFSDTSGIHLFSLDLYNRNQVWRQIVNFNHVIVGENNQEKIGHSPYVSDASTYKEILEQLRNPSKQGGQYIHTVTIQNHSAYLEGYYDESIKATSNTLTNDSLKSIETYAQGLKYTDDATKDFIDAINQLDKNVTVVFYGDHLPGIYDYKDSKSIVDKNFALGHLTDYFIYNNKTKTKLNYPVVAPYEFANIAREQTNAKVTAFDALMTMVQ